MVCISAAGAAMPPFAISDGQQVQAAWSVEAPGGTRFACSTNASMTQETFPLFIDHFIANLPSGYDFSKPTILLLDNHNSRHSSKALEKCKEKNIHPFGLLANATHFLQPCDRFVIANYKQAFNTAAQKYFARNGGSSIGKSALGHLLSQAQLALTPEAIRESWKSSGLFPLDSQLLSDHPQVIQPTDEEKAATAIAPAVAHSATGLGRNGAVITSGLLLTSPAVMAAVVLAENKRESKGSAKKVKAKRRLSLGTSSRKLARTSVGKRAQSPDDSDKENEQQPAAASSIPLLSPAAASAAAHRSLRRVALAQTSNIYRAPLSSLRF